MTLYMDTSALVKLYVDEAESAEFRKIANSTEFIGTSVLSYVEACSAFARRRREHTLTHVKVTQAITQLDARWPHYIVIDVTEQLIRAAAVLVKQHPLRAYDALHLASAIELQTKLKRPVTFAAFDAPLVKAAKKEKLLTLS